jgi:hypothetical protein
MSGQPTVIYSAASMQQAYLLRGLLEDEGIAARVVNDAMQIAGGELPVGWTAAARVVVPSEDALRARQFAEAFDRKAARGLQDELTTRAADVVPADEVSGGWEWPCCSRCGMRRTGQCPACGELGTDFPIADYQPGRAEDETLFVCPGCDDPILPAWYRYCAGCGYDFGSGVEPPPAPPAMRLSGSAAAVLAALVIIVASFVAYFWWLLS